MGKKQIKKRGRLVWNHSTHLPGLIPMLEKRLVDPAITTITPGALSRVRVNVPQLKLRISVAISGEYKAIALRGTTVQAVFIVTDLSQPEFQALFTIALAKVTHDERSAEVGKREAANSANT